MTRAYELRHVVGFEETNFLGNVYFVSPLRWQGRCRELFLREHAPGILRELEGGLRLVTVHCSCDYLAELFALDEVVVRMRLAELARGRVVLDFETWRVRGGEEELAARGRQEVASMCADASGALVAVPLPAELRAALTPFLAG